MTKKMIFDIPPSVLGVVISAMVTAASLDAQTPAARTEKPPLHAKHWLAITGKPLSATAGALAFAKGGNAVDAACAMLAAGTTMFDVLSWGTIRTPRKSSASTRWA